MSFKTSTLMAKRFFQEYKLVASEVGRDVPFLKDTSCMDEETRTIIAYCQMFKILYPEEKEFNELLKTIVSALEPLGFAQWKRDILTDMGLREAKKKEAKVSLKDLRKHES